MKQFPILTKDTITLQNKQFSWNTAEILHSQTNIAYTVVHSCINTFLPDMTQKFLPGEFSFWLLVFVFMIVCMNMRKWRSIQSSSSFYVLHMQMRTPLPLHTHTHMPFLNQVLIILVACSYQHAFSPPSPDFYCFILITCKHVNILLAVVITMALSVLGCGWYE